MAEIKLIQHAKGAPGLRLFGLGPRMKPLKGMLKLKQFLDQHAFWAKGRTYKDLKTLLANSSVIVSLWKEDELIGFGRATSDTIFRAVLWDIVVANEYQGKGLGSRIVKSLLDAPSMKKVERVYLMTTHCSDFYRQSGFEISQRQTLLIKEFS